MVCLQNVKKGSRTTPDGYWMRLSQELSGRSKPSPAFIKAVYCYWHKDLQLVQSQVMQLLPDDDQVTNCYIL